MNVIIQLFWKKRQKCRRPQLWFYFVSKMLDYLIKSIALNRPVCFVSLVQCPYMYLYTHTIMFNFRLIIACSTSGNSLKWHVTFNKKSFNSPEEKKYIKESLYSMFLITEVDIFSFSSCGWYDNSQSCHNHSSTSCVWPCLTRVTSTSSAAHGRADHTLSVARQVRAVKCFSMRYGDSFHTEWWYFSVISWCKTFSFLTKSAIYSLVFIIYK